MIQTTLGLIVDDILQIKYESDHKNKLVTLYPCNFLNILTARALMSTTVVIVIFLILKFYCNNYSNYNWILYLDVCMCKYLYVRKLHFIDASALLAYVYSYVSIASLEVIRNKYFLHSVFLLITTVVVFNLISRLNHCYCEWKECLNIKICKCLVLN